MRDYTRFFQTHFWNLFSCAQAWLQLFQMFAELFSLPFPIPTQNSNSHIVFYGLRK